MKRYLVAVAAVVAGVLAFAGARWAVQGGLQGFRQSEASIERQFDDYAANDAMMQTFSETYPADWAAFRNEMIGGASSGSLSSQDMAARGHDFMRQFMLRKTAALVAAPDAEMVAMIRADGAFLRYLQANDLAACATHAMEGLGPDARISPEALALMTASVSQRLRSARAGEDTPASRDAVSEADGNALGDAMIASGVPMEQVDALFSGSVTVAPDRTQCDATVGLYDGLDRLPAPQAARLYASIIQGAAQGQ